MAHRGRATGSRSAPRSGSASGTRSSSSRSSSRAAPFSTHIVEGAMPVDGRWTFEEDGAGGTRVRFVAEGPVTGPMRLLEPLLRRGVARSFRHYHALLARNVEASAG